MSVQNTEARSTYPRSYYTLRRFYSSLKVGRQRLHESWNIYSHNRLAVLGLILLITYAIMAILHPILMSTVWDKTIYDPTVGYDPSIFPHPSLPSPKHLLGTDTLGRDVLSMLLAAATPTFIMAMVAAFTTAIISILIGAYSAYYRGSVDILFSTLADMFLLIPAPLVMVIVGTGNIGPVEFGLMYGLIAGMGGSAIIMRSIALTNISKSFIDASRVAGSGATRIIFWHLIPQMIPLASVQMLLTVTGVVFADGFSSFLGLSRIRINWGSMIYSSLTYMSINGVVPWNVLIPSALIISLFAASFYFIARGLHEVAEPRLRS
jgi:peptide/nickel transport system permease protein